MTFPPCAVLIAPNKFKGSLGATGVARAVGRGLKRAFPTARIYEHPIADGGEGTIEVALGHGFRPETVDVHGPLSDKVCATFTVLDDTAVIEMASAAGFAQLGAGGP